MHIRLSLRLLGAAFAIGGFALLNATVITIPGGSNVLVTGINDSGEMVANYTDSAGTAHCVAITGSTMVEIVDPNEVGTGPGFGTSCWGINNSGQIVGSYSLSVFGNGFAWTGVEYVDIGFPGATAGTTAYGLNNIGQIVGSYADNVGQHGFVYTVPTASFVTLDVPGAYASLAIGINDSGVVTFEWVNSSFVFSGALYKAGHYKILTAPGMVQTKARGINANGVVVMNTQDSAGAWHGFLLHNGTYTEFNAPGSVESYPFGINSSLEIVGGFNPTKKPSVQYGFEIHY